MGNLVHKDCPLPKGIPSFIRSEIRWYIRTMAEGGAGLGSTPGQGDALELWAVSIVEYSSQYDNNSWPATAACGPPRVFPRYGDIAGAWAPQNHSNQEFISLKYKEALYVDRLEIYETYHAGAVKKVQAQDKDLTWHQLWINPGPATNIQHSRIFDVNITPTAFKTDTIRIELDCTVAGTWCEIDAVKLTGVRTRIEPPPPMSNLSDDMASLVGAEDFSDVTFLVEGREVRAHRAILSARSEYFRAMFKDKTSNFCTPVGKQMKMSNIGYEAFMVIMQYLYTNRILDEPSPTTLAEVTRAADMYNMEDLERMAKYQVKIQIDINNVISIYLEATQKIPILPTVEQVCVDFISRNLQKVCRTKAFCNLPQDTMLTIVQMCTEKLSIS